MSESVTKNDIKDLIKELRAEDMGHNNYYNVPPYAPATRGEVSTVINSALFWIGALATVLTFVGLLIYAIYSKDSTSKDSRIDANTIAIRDIQKTQTETNSLIVDMQGNQERITKQIENNARTLDEINRNYNDMRMTRFTDKDGDGLKGEVDEKIRTVQTEFIRENTELKNDLRTLEQTIEDLRLLKATVQDNKSELNRRSTFMDDMKDRVKTLENKAGVH